MYKYEYIINATRFYCPKCGGEYLVKHGFTPDGRQILKCMDCKRKTSTNPQLRGQGFSNKDKLLPFLTKEFDELDKGELYSLGWMISDGTVSKMHALSLSVQYCDREVLEIVKKALIIPNKIRTYDRTHEGKGIACILSWSSKFAIEHFKRFGLFTNKTANEVWLPYMANHHFLRGLFDGDGGFSFHPYRKGKNKMNGSGYFCCANLLFINLMNEYLLEKADVKSSVYKTSKSIAYGVTYSITEAEKLGDFLYQDSEGLRLERKYNKYLEIKNRHS